MFGLKKSKEKSAPEARSKSWMEKLKQGLSKTRSRLGDGLVTLLKGKKEIDAEVLKALETLLIGADMGVATTQDILARLTAEVDRASLADAAQIESVLKTCLLDILTPCEKSLVVDQKPFVCLVVGVNGAGKTTSIAKIANYYKNQGHKLLLAAGDTFRAAAIEQLQSWGERNEVPVIAQASGSDSASVIFDALDAALARDTNMVIADTAGRLHTQDHLMAELEKIKRVIKKKIEDAPHETLLVLDASQGQNALVQAKTFHEHLGLTGIVMTKLDGTARGGMLVAVANELKLPIRFIGVGEDLHDLKPFCAQDFVDALFAT